MKQVIDRISVEQLCRFGIHGLVDLVNKTIGDSGPHINADNLPEPVKVLIRSAQSLSEKYASGCELFDSPEDYVFQQSDIASDAADYLSEHLGAITQELDHALSAVRHNLLGTEYEYTNAFIAVVDSIIMPIKSKFLEQHGIDSMYKLLRAMKDTSLLKTAPRFLDLRHGQLPENIFKRIARTLPVGILPGRN